MIGFRAQSATLIASRILLPGQGNRPGVLGCDAQEDVQGGMFRAGNFGSFGEWEDTDAMQFEFLANAADANPVVFIDLQPVRLGPG